MTLLQARVDLVRNLLRDEGIDPVGDADPASSWLGADCCEASDTQRRLWFLDRLSPGSATYHIPFALRLRGPLDRRRLDDSLTAIAARHEGLRTTLPTVDGRPVQVIRAATERVEAELDELCGIAQDRREDEALDRATQEARRPFDLSAGPLWRAKLFRTAANTHLLVFTFHHAIFDGWSLMLFVRDLEMHYGTSGGSGVAPRSNALQFADATAWQRARAASGAGAEHLDYWLARLANPPAPIELSTQRRRLASSSGKGGVAVLPLPDALIDGLAAAGRRHRATLFMVALAGYAAWLRHRSGQTDILVATPVAARARMEWEPLIGAFVNTVLLRIDASGTPTFDELVVRTREVTIDAFVHQDTPADRVVEMVRRAGPTSRAPLVQVAFTLTTTPLGQPALENLETSIVSMDLETAKTDLSLGIARRARGWVATLQYDADLFTAAAAARMLGEIAELLTACAARPDVTVGSLLPAARTGRAPEVSLAPTDLTDVQTRIWIDQRLHPGVPLYNVATALTIRGAIDPAAFARAFQQLADSTPAFRTSFVEQDGLPRQLVGPPGPVPIEYADEPLTDDELKAWLVHRAAPPFAMAGPLFRSALLRRAPDCYVWLLVQHHLVTDGWTVGLLCDQLAAWYAFERGGGEMPRALPAFQDQAGRLRAAAEARRTADAQYWEERLAAVEPLRYHGSLPVKHSTRIRRRWIELAPEEERALHEIAAAFPGDTADQRIFLLVAATIYAWLFRTTGQHGISIGVPFHNRRTPVDKETVGLFMEVLPIAVVLDDSDSFLTLAGKVRRAQRQALRHPHCPAPAAVLARACDVAFNYHRTRVHEFGTLPSRLDWVYTGHERESVAIQLLEIESGRHAVGFDFHEDVFDPDQSDRTVDVFFSLMRSCLADPAGRIVDARLASDETLRQQDDGNDRARHHTSSRTVLALIAAQAAATPEAVAIEAPAGPAAGTIDYRTLVERANHLANQLRLLGIGRGSIVVLCLARSIELIVAVLGVLEAGAAYLPLDVRLPGARLGELVALSGATVIIGGSDAPAVDGCRTVSPADIAAASGAIQVTDATAMDDLAYVIYTSGSTGTPKGVEIPHRALANYTEYAADRFDLHPGDRVLQFAALSFDTAAEEIFPTLASGATLVLRSDDMVDTPAAFVRSLRERRVAVLNLPTAYWHVLVESGARLPDSVRLVLIGGEAVQSALLCKWRAAGPPWVRLLNGYGPTEATIVTTFAELTAAGQSDSEPTPIGYPVWNAQVYILDAQGRRVPRGTAGELYIGGAGLARGYRGEPALTAERFVPNPFFGVAGDRLYRTGDRVRMRPDGALAFLGRLDQQVKVRGHRVEPGEIEAGLRRHAAVHDAAVVLDQADSAGSLIAFVELAPGAAIASAALRAFVAGVLPEYMIPASIVVLPALPRTSSGKIDRPRLPLEVATVPRIAGAAPRTPIETLLAQQWRDVLRRPAVDITENFFEAGGHSLLAAQLAARVASALDLEFPLALLFEHPTIAGLAAALEPMMARQAPADTDAMGRMLAEIEALSEDEAQRLVGGV
ncbi:MAG: amino acid adenylation domain-containing protein [Vicinamibacterales bacterium]